MASHSLTTNKLLAWINASTGSNIVLAATPNTDSLTLLQECLDAAIAHVETICRLPEVYPVEVERAILMLAVRLWERRLSPSGIVTDEFGTTRVGSRDPDIGDLLAPYRRWNFA